MSRKKVHDTDDDIDPCRIGEKNTNGIRMDDKISVLIIMLLLLPIATGPYGQGNRKSISHKVREI